MDKKLQEELKQKLKDQKLSLETELGKFANKDKELKGDWDTKFPEGGTSTGGNALEEAADQVTEYSNLLPVEHNMELRIQDINKALDKIKKGNYGKCENCGKDIPEARLEIYPEAKVCGKCQN